MKKIILLSALLLALGAGSRSMAQMQVDCDEAVLARYDYNEYALANIDIYKYTYICAMSQHAFRYADELPGEATVMDITVLYDYKLQQQVTSTYNEANLPYYFRFNYEQLQYTLADKNNGVIYFTLHNGTHAYLVLESQAYIASKANEELNKILPANE